NQDVVVHVVARRTTGYRDRRRTLDRSGDRRLTTVAECVESDDVVAAVDVRDDLCTIGAIATQNDTVSCAGASRCTVDIRLRSNLVRTSGQIDGPQRARTIRDCYTGIDCALDFRCVVSDTVTHCTEISLDVLADRYSGDRTRGRRGRNARPPNHCLAR